MHAAATRLDPRGIPDNDQPFALIAKLSGPAPGASREARLAQVREVLHAA